MALMRTAVALWVVFFILIAHLGRDRRKAKSAKGKAHLAGRQKNHGNRYKRGVGGKRILAKAGGSGGRGAAKGRKPAASRKPQSVEISLASYSRPGSPRTYVAEITGTGGKYGLEREFQSPSSRSRSGSGKTGKDTFTLEEGKTYEIAEPYKDRRYVKIANGQENPVPRPGSSERKPSDTSKGPTAAEQASSKLKERAKQPVPTTLPPEWKRELEIAESSPGYRKVIKNRALSMSKSIAIPAEAAIGRMLLEEIRKRGW